jgi:hypothetical protein
MLDRHEDVRELPQIMQSLFLLWELGLAVPEFDFSNLSYSDALSLHGVSRLTIGRYESMQI